MNISRLLCLLLLVHIARAQVINSKLDNDPVFTTVLSRRMTYPVEAERLGIYAKIYAGFRIDQKGHIQEVKILNPVRIGYGFEEIVLKKLKLLPSLNPNYKGDYVLPVVFALVDNSNNSTVISPTGRLPNIQLGDRILLNDLRVVSRKLPIWKGNELAPYIKNTVPNQ